MIRPYRWTFGYTPDEDATARFRGLRRGGAGPRTRVLRPGDTYRALPCQGTAIKGHPKICLPQGPNGQVQRRAARTGEKPVVIGFAWAGGGIPLAASIGHQRTCRGLYRADQGSDGRGRTRLIGDSMSALSSPRRLGSGQPTNRTNDSRTCPSGHFAKPGRSCPLHALAQGSVIFREVSRRLRGKSVSQCR
jgi:hypothetical protein